MYLFFHELSYLEVAIGISCFVRECAKNKITNSPVGGTPALCKLNIIHWNLT